jgi:D-alanyl-D-alanine carboxypeptidase
VLLAVLALLLVMDATASGPPTPVATLKTQPKPPVSTYAMAPARVRVNPKLKLPLKSGLLFDVRSGRVLWEKNPTEQLPIASLTKMMTALLIVQSAPPDAPVLVTREAVDMPGSKVGVLPLGRHVPLESLLYGLLLPSGNDAAVALAQHVDGTVNKFVVRMNEEAAELGLGCTRYSSPSGYYNQGNFSCAADLAVLAHLDMQQPRIARIVGTYEAILPFPIPGGKLYLDNNNPLLIYKYPGVTGMKTGQTEAAGRCLVATAERHGVRLGAIVLHSEDPGTQARQLLDLGFEDVYHQPIVPEAPFPPGV